MTPKEKQRELIVEIMKADEQLGLYPTRKQTAVDWLIKEVELISNSKGISRDKIIELYNRAIQQAKEMEKEQIKSAYIEGCWWRTFKYDVEKYYKENYE